MSKKKDTIVDTTTNTEAVEDTAVEDIAVEDAVVEDTVVEDTILDVTSEQYIKQTSIKILNEVKANHNLPFQGLFIMYLKDIISKINN